MLATCQKNWDNNETIYAGGRAGRDFFQGLVTIYTHRSTLIITVYADENPHYDSGKKW